MGRISDLILNVTLLRRRDGLKFGAILIHVEWLLMVTLPSPL